MHLIEEHAAGVMRDAAFNSFANRARLLENFLEHEMLEAAFFRLNRIPSNSLTLRHHRISSEVGHAYAGFCHHGNLAIAEKENVASMFEDCRNVGSDEELAVAQANNDGRSLAS